MKRDTIAYTSDGHTYQKLIHFKEQYRHYRTMANYLLCFCFGDSLKTPTHEVRDSQTLGPCPTLATCLRTERLPYCLGTCAAQSEHTHP